MPSIRILLLLLALLSCLQSQIVPNSSLPLISNCIYQHPNGSSCMICSAGYVLTDNGLCILTTTPQCNQISLGVCVSCNIGSVLIDDACVPLAKPSQNSNQIATTNGTDAQANNAIPSGLDGLSMQLSPAAEVPTLSFSDISNTSSSTITINSTRSSIQNCIASINNGTICSMCSEGYYLQNNMCYFLDSKCSSLDIDGTCRNCSNGLIPYQSRCVYFDPYCLMYNDRGICNLTSSLFTLRTPTIAELSNYRANIISATNQYSNLTFGTNGNLFAGVVGITIGQYDLNGNIIYCQGLRIFYNKFSGQCINYTDNCTQYNALGLCLHCSQQYDLNQASQCVLRSNLTCANITSSGCTKGQYGYVVINNQAYPQVGHYDQNGVAAQPGYFIRSDYNLTWPNDWNCQFQNMPGNCLNCQKGYTPIRVISGFSCVVAQSNCTSYSVYGLCTQCQSGFRLWIGRCVVDHCFQMDCFQCSSIPFFNQYYLGNCISPLIQNCLIYNGPNCNNCAPDFYFGVNQTCLPKSDTNCKDVAQSGTCLRCYPGYTFRLGFFKNSSTCLIAIPNCVAVKLGNCTACISGYILYRDGKCYQASKVPRIPCNYDQYQDNTTHCIKICKSGQVYDNITKTCSSKCLQNQQLVNDTVCVTRCAPGNQWANGYCSAISSKYINLACDPPSAPPCNKCINSSLYKLINYTIVDFTCIASNCDAYNPARAHICLNCSQGWNLTANGSCIPISTNPIVNPACISNSGDACSRCVSTSYYNFANRNCYVSNCMMIAVNQIWNCSKCLPEYVLTQNNTCKLKNPACFYSYENCVGCTSGGYSETINIYNEKDCQVDNCRARDSKRIWICIQCNQNYQLQANGSCIINQNYPTTNPFCLPPPSPTPNQKCSSCSTKQFYIFNNTCVPVNCANWDQVSPWICRACYPNYYLLPNGTCILQNPYCFPSTSNCISCTAGFFWINQTCVPMNCQSWNWANPSNCLNCNNGYDLLANGTCIMRQPVNIQPGCTSSYPCSACSSAYYTLRNQNCVPTNCNQNDQARVWICLTCANNYILLGDGTCSYNPNTNPINIACLPQQSPPCSACISNDYVLTSQTCIPNHCLAYNQSVPYICLRCSQGYELMADGTCQNTTSKNQCLPSPSNCTRCSQGYTLINQHCVVDHCAVWNQNTPWICLKCQDNYVLTADGLCQYITPSNQPGCTTPYPCIQCVSVSYVLVNRDCVPANCSKYLLLQPWNCTQCYQNYQLLADGSCQQSNPSIPAQGCTTPFPCKSCLPNYYLLGQYCIILHCYQWNASRPFICLNCSLGYRLNPATNTCEDIRCITPNPFNRSCSACINGYTLIDNTYCVINNCTIYDRISGDCSACQPPYIISYPSLLCVPANCSNFASAFVCNQCAYGFALVGGLCFYQNNSVAYCSKYDFWWNCLQCTPSQGYVVINSGCASVIVGCVQYDQKTGVCLSCNSSLQRDPSGLSCNTPINYKYSQASSLSCAKFITTSNPPAQWPAIGSSYYWLPQTINPPSFILSFISCPIKLQTIDHLTMLGNLSGFLSTFYIMARNDSVSTFSCLFNCNQFNANNDTSTPRDIAFPQPQTVGELQIWPLTFVGDIALQVEAWIPNQNYK